MGFSKDLAVGKDGENIAIEVFQKHGLQVQTVPKELRRWYDFSVLLRDKEFQVECKYDLRANKTQNIAIEVGNSKTQKPAGIMLTKADIWCHVFSPSSVWLCSAALLRAYVQDCPFGFVRKIEGGGDGNADLLLFKRDSMLSLLFTEISGLDKNKFIRVLDNLC